MRPLRSTGSDHATTRRPCGTASEGGHPSRGDHAALRQRPCVMRGRASPGRPTAPRKRHRADDLRAIRTADRRRTRLERTDCFRWSERYAFDNKVSAAVSEATMWHCAAGVPGDMRPGCARSRPAPCDHRCTEYGRRHQAKHGSDSYAPVTQTSDRLVTVQVVIKWETLIKGETLIRGSAAARLRTLGARTE